MNWLKHKIKSFFSTPQFSLSSGIRIYAIGDIHGCFPLLKKKISLIQKDLELHKHKRNILITLGDYIDRGLYSKQVIECLLKDIPPNMETIFLKGNHEESMMGFLKEPMKHRHWLDFGGLQTLSSYGVDISGYPYDQKKITHFSQELNLKLPTEHYNFLLSLHASFTIEDYFFVHAGIHPDCNLQDQSEKDLLRIRDPFIRSKKIFEKYIIHGHTPSETIEYLPNRLNLDTGAFITGKLSCGVFEKKTISFL